MFVSHLGAESRFVLVSVVLLADLTVPVNNNVTY